MKKIMTGNEAIAQGAWEAGLHIAAAYPGTPSTEILENLSAYRDVYSEWSTNEKVALEVAAGASMAGARSLAARCRCSAAADNGLPPAATPDYWRGKSRHSPDCG